MTLTLPQELLLLSLTAEGRVVRSNRMDFGLVGGCMIELSIAGRITLEGKKLQVIDRRPTGAEPQDSVLAKFAESKPRKPADWMPKLERRCGRSAVAETLLGVLRAERRTHLRIFYSTRYMQADPALRDGVLARLEGPVLRGTGPDERTAALASLVLAVELQKHLFPGADRKAVKRRLKEISEGEWAGAAVKKAIAAASAAIVSAGADGGGGGGE
jgi:hypothetical protein